MKAERAHLVGSKGGVGTTTIAVSIGLAMRLNVMGAADLDAVRGGSCPPIPGKAVVIDQGTTPIGVDLEGPTLVVVRNCYLSLRGALARPTDGAILVYDQTRALSIEDVRSAITTPVISVVPLCASVARTIDAGLLGVRLPKELAGPVGEVAEWLERWGGR